MIAQPCLSLIDDSCDLIRSTYAPIFKCIFEDFGHLAGMVADVFEEVLEEKKRNAVYMASHL